MARPREFDEAAVLDTVVACFWRHGYEATSVRDLMEQTGLTGASLYNAFGDKRSLYERALDHYVERSVADRIRRCEMLEPRPAIEAFFCEIVNRSVDDQDRKGCLLVNAALEVAPHDPGFQKAVWLVLVRIETFFRKQVEFGQANGTVSDALPAAGFAQNLLGVLLGLRVLARVRPERALLEGVVMPALVQLDPLGLKAIPNGIL